MKPLKIIVCLIVMIAFVQFRVLAQDPDTLYRNSDDILLSDQADLAERWNDGEADLNDEISASKKIDINKCEVNDLIRIGIKKEQAENVLRYRKQAGYIMDVHELQAVPGLDGSSLNILIRYAKVKQRKVTFKGLLQDLIGGKSVLNVRADFYQTNGVDYTKYKSEDATSFMQSARTRIRYIHTGSHLDVSMVCEKDAGETFGWNKRQKGMDLYIGNVRYRGDGLIRQLLMGDYKVSMGQGLIIWQGFGGGLGMSGMTGRPQKEIFSPHRSYNEYYFKRGVAAELQWAHWQAGVFLSKRGLDASLQWDSIEQVQKIRSIYNTGLHADSLSNQRRNAVTEYTVGGRIVLNKPFGYFGLSAVWYDYIKSFYRNSELYAFYYPIDQRRLFTGIDYSFVKRNLHFFGEVAIMNTKSIAMLHNLSLTLSKALEIGLGYRNYNPAYRSADAMVIGLRSYPSNERGWVIQGRYSISRGTEIWAGWDIFSSKWLRYGDVQPLHGSTFMLSFQKFDKQGNGFKFRYRRGVEQKLTGTQVPTTIEGIEIANSYDFQAKIKIGINKGMFFRYVSREATALGDRSNADMFCWGLDAKGNKEISVQWRMYLMEGASSVGGVALQEADLGGGQQVSWLYGNTSAYSLLCSKMWNKKLKMGLKLQVKLKGLFNSNFEKSVIDKIISISTHYLF